MNISVQTEAQTKEFPLKNNPKGQKPRKSGLNTNKEGSVRKINGHVYFDFKYLNERVRENAGPKWNDENAKFIRGELDKIMMAIKSGTFQ